jgi:hypothetical protein
MFEASHAVHNPVMEREGFTVKSRVGGVGWGARMAVALIGLGLAGCTAAAGSGGAPAASARASGSVAGSPLGSVAPSPSLTIAPSPTPAWTPAAVPVTTPSPTAEAEPTSCATAPSKPSQGEAPPAAPTATWTSVRWQELPAAALPNEFAKCIDEFGDPAGLFSLFGWSKGYVVFEQNTDDSGNIDVVVPYESADGRNWRRGKPLSMDKIMGEDFGTEGIKYIVEGPAGLAAVASSTPARCGWGAGEEVDTILTSTDGLTWTSINMAKAFDDESISFVAAGSAGYMASRTEDVDGPTKIWTSPDGRTWHPVDLSSSAFNGSVVQDPAAFAGGLLITGYTDENSSCTGGALVKPTVWRSADGGSWTRVDLPGSKLGTSATTTAIRLTDHLVMVQGTTMNASTPAGSQYWTSQDGLTWMPIADPGIDPLALVTDGVRAFDFSCVAADSPAAQSACARSAPEIQAIDDNVKLSSVAQTGPIPPYTNADTGMGWTVAVGPTGFVVVDSNGAIWLGLPSAG